MKEQGQTTYTMSALILSHFQTNSSNLGRLKHLCCLHELPVHLVHREKNSAVRGMERTWHMLLYDLSIQRELQRIPGEAAAFVMWTNSILPCSQASGSSGIFLNANLHFRAQWNMGIHKNKAHLPHLFFFLSFFFPQHWRFSLPLSHSHIKAQQHFFFIIIYLYIKWELLCTVALKV